jgi:L,D-peptidoglycan transpeptidase YkuD (ErfK/YbiS/YcfS/YnhG family)
MDLTVLPDGLLQCGGRGYRCALGSGGTTTQKREGDGATPAGCFALRRVLYRADRLVAPETGLDVAPIGATDGWCDDPADPGYNQAVRLPCSASHERLWRDDAVYDVVIVLGHNDDPPKPKLGSAIFMHVARPDFAPTEGCVALELGDLLEVLAACGPGDRICIKPAA